MESRPDPWPIRAIDGLNRAFVFVAAAATLVLMFHVVADVAGRYLANRPIAGTLEYVTFWWMPIIVFLALGWAQYRGEHINVTILTETLEFRVRRIVESVADVLSVVIVGMLVSYSFAGAERAFGIGEAALGTATVLIWPMKFVAVIGLVGYLLQIVATLYRRWTQPETVPDLDDELAKAGIE